DRSKGRNDRGPTKSDCSDCACDGRSTGPRQYRPFPSACRDARNSPSERRPSRELEWHWQAACGATSSLHEILAGKTGEPHILNYHPLSAKPLLKNVFREPCHGRTTNHGSGARSKGSKCVKTRNPRRLVAFWHRELALCGE